MAVARFQIRSIKLSCDLDKVSYLAFTSVDKIFSKISPYNLRISQFTSPPSSVRISENLADYLSSVTELEIQSLIQSILDKRSDSPFLHSIRGILSQFKSIPIDSVLVLTASFAIPSRDLKCTLGLTFPYTIGDKNEITR